MEKLAGIRIEVPEVTQSEEGQKKKLELVVQAVNRIVSPTEQPKWDAELIHSKDIVAIMQILIAMVLHFRAPIRLPEHVSVKVAHSI
ncbi:hypothetical protein ANCDUO_23345 [Ancylostoma duodenale]|uniref:Calponin-homology (CH) domain-containing protein n=1 Tax=Ancylostoma duodenale TaxID=51022 RepID=A0A0C2C9V4_9BILA|nr:hypothetical protein ANCDUO_23345 [Ancylostoma duodenale]